MSVIRTVAFSCDSQAVGSCHVQSEASEGTSTAHKTYLRTQGWRFRNGVHRCPACASHERFQAAQARDPQQVDG
jgi:hypothetical protein